MNATTTNKLLRQAGATRSYPTTRKGIDAQLERIAAGKDHHKPTLAHPYARCFTKGDCDHRDRVRDDRRGYFSTTYGPAKSCAEYIAEQESARSARLSA